MQKKIVAFFLILILLYTVLLSGCSNQKIMVNDATYMLGTQIQISVWADNENEGKTIIKECFERISQIEKKMSVNIESSEVSEINRNAGKTFIKVSEDTSKVLNKTLYYAELSNGAFDPTIGKLVKLWGIGTENEAIPQKLDIDNALKYVDYKLLKKEDNDKFKLDAEGMRMDLGGIAKGYAADEVYQILKSEGIKHAIINLGGNVFALGKKMDENEWKIGIQDPLEPTGTHMGVIEVSDKAIVTSGNYERFFIKNNKRYHHIIDPKTGYPSENGIISSTIITKHSVDADALSTAVYVLGVEKGLGLVENLEDVECIIITQDHNVYLSSGIKEKFQVVNSKFQLKNRD